MQNSSEFYVTSKMWTRDATTKLIEMYQVHECMWKTTSPLYRNKQKRNEALLAIANAVRNHRPLTTVEDVKNKINGIRTQYVAEINKLISSENRGEPYVPSLWCFEMLTFLKPFTQPKQRCVNETWTRMILPKPQPMPSIISSKLTTISLKPIQSFNSPNIASKLHSVFDPLSTNRFQLSEPRKEPEQNSFGGCVVIKDEIDDDIEIVEEEDTLNTDDDNYSDNNSMFVENPIEESHQQSTNQKSYKKQSSDSGVDESQQEQERVRRLFSPGLNPEITLVPKKELMKRKHEESLGSEESFDDKKKKIEPWKEDIEDRVSIFGKFVMSQMRTINNKVLLMKLEHTIQNAIIEAQLKQVEMDENKDNEKKDGKIKDDNKD